MVFTHFNLTEEKCLTHLVVRMMQKKRIEFYRLAIDIVIFIYRMTATLSVSQFCAIVSSCSIC